MSKKALLMILDGWGIGDQGKDDVIFNTPTPYWDSLLAAYPHSELQASGENVGLPDGQMGNSEVGHLNIGAGRIVYQDLVKINRACADGSILKNKEIVSAFSYAKENGKNIHFMGLTSNGGVHSSFDHLFKLCDISKEYGIENTFIHCFMDGRDTDPKSGKGFIEQLTAHCEKSAGKIASIVGRFYAMDRDKRWERVKEAYDLLLKEDFPSWLYQVKKGATTIWEHWDGMKDDGSMWSADMNSFNHYAYGAIGEWMYRAMAGIEADPEHPGFKHAILYPRIGGNLKYTAGKYHSIYGDVGVKWEVQGKQITLTVQIPVNTTAEIRLDQAKAVLESDGLTFTREADYMAAEAGSGTYHIAFEQ